MSPWYVLVVSLRCLSLDESHASLALDRVRVMRLRDAMKKSVMNSILNSMLIKKGLCLIYAGSSRKITKKNKSRIVVVMSHRHERPMSQSGTDPYHPA